MLLMVRVLRMSYVCNTVGSLLCVNIIFFYRCYVGVNIDFHFDILSTRTQILRCGPTHKWILISNAMLSNIFAELMFEWKTSDKDDPYAK